LLGFTPSPSKRRIRGGYAFLRNAKIPTAHLVAVGKKRLEQTRSHPRHGDDLGVWGIPQQAIFEIDLQGEFSKIRKLVQVCTACRYQRSPSASPLESHENKRTSHLIRLPV
jgi:hypothetical protein